MLEWKSFFIPQLRCTYSSFHHPLHGVAFNYSLMAVKIEIFYLQTPFFFFFDSPNAIKFYKTFEASRGAAVINDCWWNSYGLLLSSVCLYEFVWLGTMSSLEIGIINVWPLCKTFWNEHTLKALSNQVNDLTVLTV